MVPKLCSAALINEMIEQGRLSLAKVVLQLLHTKDRSK